jgi:hypothetical protein
MKFKLLGMFLLCLSLLTAAYAATPQGAIVQAINISGKVASITVLNTTDKPITGVSLALVAHFADGHEEPSEYTEDYGPLTGQVIAPHQVGVIAKPYASDPTSVDARVSMVIYKDGTAEASNPRTLNDIIAERVGTLKALQASVTALRDSLSDPHPTQYVTDKLTAASADKTVSKGWLDETIKRTQAAASRGQERSFIQSEIKRLDGEAQKYAPYANVRAQ